MVADPFVGVGQVWPEFCVLGFALEPCVDLVAAFADFVEFGGVGRLGACGTVGSPLGEEIGYLIVIDSGVTWYPEEVDWGEVMQCHQGSCCHRDQVDIC